MCTYIWNAHDQLVEIKQGTASIASFGYDPLGRRVSKTEGGQTVSYMYDGLDAVQETQGGAVNPILTGLGIDERCARNEASGRAYFLSDALGSTRALTNASGALIQRYDYTPYGQTSQASAGASNPYQYTGRERDASGFYYYRARYYRSELGHFVSEDPIGLAGGANAYSYVHGSPLMYGDPLGLFDLPSIPQPVVDAVAGFGDSLSFGLTNYIRDQWGINGAVEKSSADIIAGAGRTSIWWTSLLVGGGLVGSATRAGRIGGNCGSGQ
ncbi:RHS repeat-associated core domain-containing protein [Xanthomonas sacchari]|uniref:RHS repeat-associated core domain-containing protein n=1 Tax=Xanthomonas sacchari TaxID=56458 RepID=UPI00224F219C|nr:RHS repeat-associated core domain-containing protein [Xanthomonas sacchari]